jgi:hypothetical protein
MQHPVGVLAHLGIVGYYDKGLVTGFVHRPQ